MGKFVVKTTKSGFVFNLKAGNGEVIATSESYKSQDSCLNGVESVRKNCVGGVEDQTVEGFEKLTHPKFEVYADKAGEFRFRLKARNGEVIAVSEGYINSMSSVRVKKFQPPVSRSSSLVNPKPVPLTAQVVPRAIRERFKWADSWIYHRLYPALSQLLP